MGTRRVVWAGLAVGGLLVLMALAGPTAALAWQPSEPGVAGTGSDATHPDEVGGQPPADETPAVNADQGGDQPQAGADPTSAGAQRPDAARDARTLLAEIDGNQSEPAAPSNGGQPPASVPRLDHLYAGERRPESGLPDGLGVLDTDSDPTPQDETSPASVAMKGLPAPPAPAPAGANSTVVAAMKSLPAPTPPAPAEDGAAASAMVGLVGWPAAWSGESAAAAVLDSPGPATASVDGEAAPPRPGQSLAGSADAAVGAPAVARDAGLFSERLLAGVVTPRQASHLSWPRYATYAAQEFGAGFDDSSRPLVSGAAGSEPLRQLGWLATDPATARTALGWLMVAADDPASAVDEAWAGYTNMLDKEYGGPQRRAGDWLGSGIEALLPRPLAAVAQAEVAMALDPAGTWDWASEALAEHRERVWALDSWRDGRYDDWAVDVAGGMAIDGAKLVVGPQPVDDALDGRGWHAAGAAIPAIALWAFGPGPRPTPAGQADDAARLVGGADEVPPTAGAGTAGRAGEATSPSVRWVREYDSRTAATEPEVHLSQAWSRDYFATERGRRDYRMAVGNRRPLAASAEQGAGGVSVDMVLEVYGKPAANPSAQPGRNVTLADVDRALADGGAATSGVQPMTVQDVYDVVKGDHPAVVSVVDPVTGAESIVVVDESYMSYSSSGDRQYLVIRDPETGQMQSVPLSRFEQRFGGLGIATRPVAEAGPSLTENLAQAVAGLTEGAESAYDQSLVLLGIGLRALGWDPEG